MLHFTAESIINNITQQIFSFNNNNYIHIVCNNIPRAKNIRNFAHQFFKTMFVDSLLFKMNVKFYYHYFFFKFSEIFILNISIEYELVKIIDILISWNKIFCYGKVFFSKNRYSIRVIMIWHNNIYLWHNKSVYDYPIINNY